MTNQHVKLLIYAGGFAPVGGVQTFLRDLAISLRGRAIDVRLICWGARSPLLADVERSGVPVTRRSWRWGCRFGWPDRLLIPWGRLAIASADVVLFGHLQPRALNEVMRIRKRTGKPSAVLVTPYRPAEMWQQGGPPTETLDCFDAIVVQSQVFADDLRQLGYQGSIQMLPYIPPQCTTPVALPQGPLRLGFLGRLVPDKNLRYLLQSFALLCQSVKSTLHFFGDGIERPLIEKLVLTLGLKHSVLFHGVLHPCAVGSAVDSCHLFVFSSVTEGQALAALEILARGRAVVATPVGVFPELLSDGQLGALAPLNDAQGFARVLGSVGTQVENGTLFPEGVQSIYAQRFPREAILREYAKLITELATSDARKPSGAEAALDSTEC